MSTCGPNSQCKTNRCCCKENNQSCKENCPKCKCLNSNCTNRKQSLLSAYDSDDSSDLKCNCQKGKCKSNTNCGCIKSNERCNKKCKCIDCENRNVSQLKSNAHDDDSDDDVGCRCQKSKCKSG